MIVIACMSTRAALALFDSGMVSEKVVLRQMIHSQQLVNGSFSLDKHYKFTFKI